MDVNKVNEVLNKYQAIESEIQNLEIEQQNLNSELIKEQTLLQQNIDELKKYNVLPENIEKEIEKLTLELSQGINEYESISRSN